MRRLVIVCAFALLYCLQIYAAVATVDAPRKLEGAPTLPKIDDKTPDLEGYYLCAGTDQGKKYSGLVTLRKINKVYVLQYQIGLAGYTGIGFRKDNTVIVGWSRGEVRGCYEYRISTTNSGPVLVGHWVSMPGNGELQTETLTFLRALPKDDDDN